MEIKKEKKEWVLFIDGKKWIGDNLEEEIEDYEYVVMGLEDPNEILGFSNKETFKKWADSKGMLQKYEELMDRLTKARSIKYPKTPGEEEEMRKKLVKDVRDKNKKLREILKEQKIEPHEIEKIKELQKKYDFLQSGTLYDNTNYWGRPLWLPRGIHPKFSWYSFNDRAESCINHNFTTGWILLFQHTWFRGYIRIMYYRCSDLGWFRNRASSAIIF